MRITVVEDTFKCSDCKAIFKAETLFNVAISVWCAQLKTITCPDCNAPWNRLAFYREPQPDATETTSA